MPLMHGYASIVIPRVFPPCYLEFRCKSIAFWGIHLSRTRSVWEAISIWAKLAEPGKDILSAGQRHYERENM